MSDRVGVIGLGNIGGAIARRLLRSGCDVTAYDADPERLAQLAESGARVARSAGEVAGASDFVAVVVVTEDQVHDVVCGPGGILGSARAGSTIFIHSTISVAACEAVRAAAAERGVAVLDATLCAPNGAAEAGTLTAIVGGEPEIVERCRPVLERYATHVFHVGPFGMGQRVKVLNTLLSLANHVSARECVDAGVAAGVPRELMLQVFDKTGCTTAVENWAEFRAWIRAYPGGPEGLLNALVEKDVNLGLDVVAAAHAPAPVVTAASHRLRWLLEVPETTTR